MADTKISALPAATDLVGATVPIVQGGANKKADISLFDARLAGADGKTVLSGAVAPTTEGVDGDVYINTATNEIYGPKSGGAWGSATSLVGPTGATGADGTDPGVLLTWDDVNTDADPGTGNIRADNDALGSATMLYVSKTNRAGDDISAFLASLDDSTNTNKGQVTLTRSSGNAQAGFNITGITDATGYVKVAISGHWGATGFIDGNAISFQFSRSGDKGADGAGAGDVVGPSSAVNNRVATYDGTTGKLIKDSGVVLGTVAPLDVDTDGTLAANSDSKVASQKATKTYVDQIIAAQDAMVFNGVVDCSANPNYPAADRGHTYRVSVAGKIGGASGTNVEAGDLLLCLTDGTASGNQATVGTAWSIAQANLDGTVIGPASVTDGNPVLYDGTTGKLIKQATFAAFKTALAIAVADITDASANGRSFISAANYAAMTALLSEVVGDSGSGGTKGLVPAPAAGDAAAGKFLKADGTFAVPSGGSGGMTLLETLATTSGASVTTSVSLSGYRRLYIEIDGVSGSANSTFNLLTSTNGSTFGTAQSITTTSAANQFYGVLIIDMIQVAAQGRWVTGSIATSTTAVPTAIGAANASNAAGAISNVRFTMGSGSFDAGAIRVYGL